MKPEMKDEVLPLIKGMVDDMAKTVTDDELNPIKEFMVKSAKESFEENGDWASAIASTTLNGVQTFTNQIDVVNSITVEKGSKPHGYNPQTRQLQRFTSSTPLNNPI